MQKTSFPAVLATFIASYAFWILLTWSFSSQELITYKEMIENVQSIVYSAFRCVVIRTVFHRIKIW